MVKILIVDDEVDITECCVMYFKNLGYDMYGAKNSKEAFEAIEKNKPDILLLDINLRERYTGLDVLKKALQVNPKAQAIMLTGMGHEAIVEDCLKQGAKLILNKPIILEQLKETITTYVKKVEHK